jgi:4-hydroxy-tetrahydrodipicolinate synthase
MDLIFKEGNPAGIKALFEAVGLGTAVVRLPLVEATATLKKTIKSFLNTLQKTPV